MKQLSYLFIPAVMLCACKGKNKTTEQVSMQSDSTIVSAAYIPAENYTTLYGNWVGDSEVTKADFDKFKGQTRSRLNIVIKQITDSGVIAQSVINGNSRLMKGNFSASGSNRYIFELREPGDNKYDGKFEFMIENDTLTGKWYPYDTTLATKETEYQLIKKPFTYDANLMLPEEWDYIDYTNFKEKQETYKDDETGTTDTFVNQFYRSASAKVYKMNSSTQRLTEKDVKNLRKLDLQILRNTIFARHGYTFKSRAIRQFFDQVDWYIPVSDNIEADLTSLEKENIALLTRFEKYAEDNYDTFGR